MSDVLTLSCPSCGGLLEVSEGSTNAVCSHCDTPLFFHGTVNRYLVDSRIDATSALRSVRRKLEQFSGSVFSSCRVRKPFLAYVPFWLISSRVDGYVFGVRPVFKEKKVRTAGDAEDGSGVTIVRTIKQRKGVRAEEHQISNGIDMIVSGAKLEPLGIPSLGLQSQMGLSGMALGRSGSRLPLRVFDSENLPPDAHVVDPSVSLLKAREQAEKFAERLCDGAGVGLEQRCMYLAVTGSRERLVHYPLWIVDYTAGERLYRIVVDGCSGEVLKGSFPADTGHWRKVCRIVGSIWAGLVPVVSVILAAGLFRVGPVLTFSLLSLWGLGAVSMRFFKIASKNSGMDSHI
ncbi:hypothetical protein CSA37_06520 [Candidatus Fermentibacteria bacterium]|nr:MAG: hypothetical protein CSA37_06520 [Candidatus Fermentibacteria bacterium]